MSKSLFWQTVPDTFNWMCSMKTYLSALALALTATVSNAAVVAYTWEEGGGLRSTYSGSLDLTGLNRVFHGDTPSDSVYVQAHRTYFIALPPAYDAWEGANSLGAPIGTSTNTYYGNSRTGDGFGYLTDRGFVYLPDSYQSGASFAGGSFIAEVTLDQVGVTSPKIVTLSWESDTITHYWGTAAPSAVPVPAGLPLALTALGAFMVIRRRPRTS